MSRLSRYRPTPAMGVALIALFVSLGGVSYGLATGSIDSREIKNSTVRSKDIRNNQVSTRDLRNSSARGRDVRNNTLTGSDVLESSLGEVPNAASATNAAAVDGKSAGDIVLWALVPRATANGPVALTDSFGAVSAERTGIGGYDVVFDRNVTECVAQGAATDISGGAAPSGAAARMVGTDTRNNGTTSTVEVDLTDFDGVGQDPAAGDGFMISVHC